MENQETISNFNGLEEAKPKIFRQAGLVGAATLLSRCFGLLRDSMIAYVLGTRAGADAFYVAFRIPNLLRRLLAEGNLTISFIPVFSETLRESREQAKQLVDVTFTILLVFVSVLTLMGIVAASVFVRITALGFTEDPHKFALTVLLTRITFPYILLVSLGALAMGILNARKRFLSSAFAPVLLNIGIIVAAWFLSDHFEQASIAIAWGVIMGGLLQLLIQIPALVKEGFLPKLNFNWKHPAWAKVGRLMLPSVYGSAVYQINLLAMTFMASYLPTGSVSYLWYANRVMEFPLGIFAISLATVFLPTLSDHAAERDLVKMKGSLRKALAAVCLINIPAALGLYILAKPIIALLFYRGGFTQDSTLLTAAALQYFALGLPFVAAARIMASAFYAIQESKKPVRAANIAVLVNILIGFLLLWPMQHRGLALSVSIAALVNLAILLWDYRKHLGGIGLSGLAVSIFKILVAAVLMVLVLSVVQHYWDRSFAPIWQRSFYLLAMMGLGCLVYFVMVFLLRIEGLETILKRLFP